MCIYNYIAIFLFSLLLIELNLNLKQVKTAFFAICTLTLLILLGFRSNTVGIDTEEYVKMFQGLPNGYGTIDSPNEEIEPGIYYFAYIIRLLSDDYWIWHMLTSIFTLGPFIYCVNKYSSVKSLPFFLYVSINWSLMYMGLIMMRQNLSTAFFLYAMIIFINTKYKHYIILLVLCLMSIFFHRSTSFAIVLSFVLYYMKFNKRYVVGFLLLSILVGAFIENLFYDIIQFVNVVSSNDAVARFADYDESAFENEITIKGLIPPTLYVIVIVLISEKENLKDLRLRFLIVGCILYNLFSSINVAMRIVYPLTLLGLTFVPNSIMGKKMVIYKLLIVIISLYFIKMNIAKYDGRDEVDGIYPYTFFWEK